MSKLNQSDLKRTPEHDSFSKDPKEIAKKLEDEVRPLLTAYQKDPNPETFRGYMIAQAKFKAEATGEDYIEPVKYHNLSMADVFLKYLQIRNLNFFIGVLSRFKRKGLWSTPTMAVGMSKGTYYFGYHPEWYKYFPFKYTLMVLQHEAHHLLQNHIPRFLNILNTIRPANVEDEEKDLTKRDKEALNNLMNFTNLAADEDVNSLLFTKSEFYGLDTTDLVLPETYGHPKLLAYEQYLNMWLLDPYTIFQKTSSGSGTSSMKSAYKGECEGEGEGEGIYTPGDQAQKEYENTTGSDSHPWLKDLTSGNALALNPEEQEAINKAQEEAKKRGIDLGGKLPSPERINDLKDSLEKEGNRVLIETTKDHIDKKGRGSIPGNYLEKYDELTKECRLHWTDILSSMISDPKMQREDFKINKYNRNTALMPSVNKYGFKEEDPTYRLWVSIDTSGSMSHSDIEEGLAVIQGLLKVDSEIRVTVCEFDTTIHRITHMTADSLINSDVWGRGGTDFNCVFKHIQENVPDDEYPDMHIIFTDGGAAPPKQNVRIPINKLPLLWVLTSSYAVDWFKDGYGAVITTITD